MNLPALRPRHYRLRGRTMTKAEVAAMMNIAEGRIDDWVAMGAPVKEVDDLGQAATFDCTRLTEWLLRAEQASPKRRDDASPLPPSAQEIADVIGRERALFLIGKLPKAGSRSWRVCLYVPKRIGPDHPLVSLIGWRDANLLVREFGGMILQPSNCVQVHRDFRNREARRLHAEGWTIGRLADLFDLSERQVANILAGPATQG